MRMTIVTMLALALCTSAAGGDLRFAESPTPAPPLPIYSFASQKTEQEPVAPPPSAEPKPVPVPEAVDLQTSNTTFGELLLRDLFRRPSYNFRKVKLNSEAQNLQLAKSRLDLRKDVLKARQEQLDAMIKSNQYTELEVAREVYLVTLEQERLVNAEERLERQMNAHSVRVQKLNDVAEKLNK